jgi:serine protease Do
LAVKLKDLEAETIEKIKVAPLGNSKQLTVGEPAIAIGNALGYGQSVTSGIISAINREMDDFDTPLIQTDAAINPGNSGGALLNIKGEVIGINTAKVASNAVEGMGYAIPISEVKTILVEMMNKETREKVPEEKRGKLGISCVTVDDTAILYYNMPKGAYISEVVENAAAYKAGITKGSIVTKFDGNSIASSTALVDLLAYYEIGETITIEIAVPKSDGTYETKEVNVTLEAATKQ